MPKMPGSKRNVRTSLCCNSTAGISKDVASLEKCYGLKRHPVARLFTGRLRGQSQAAFCSRAPDIGIDL